MKIANSHFPGKAHRVEVDVTGRGDCLSPWPLLDLTKLQVSNGNETSQHSSISYSSDEEDLIVRVQPSSSHRVNGHVVPTGSQVPNTTSRTTAFREHSAALHDNTGPMRHKMKALKWQYRDRRRKQPPEYIAWVATVEARKRTRPRDDRQVDELWPELLMFPRIPHLKLWQLCSRVAVCWACAVTAGAIVLHY